MSRLREFRAKKNWTQAELARRSGVSRSGIAAIENGALVPSVHTALALARALDCTVEELFADTESQVIAWAWQPSEESPAFWEASFDQTVLAFPVEPLPYSILPPDGWVDGHVRKPLSTDVSKMTLVMASCDPAAGFLASVMGSKAGVRVLSFHRSSKEALSLLKKGVVHVAGTHLREVDEAGGNAAVVRDMLGKGFQLLRGAVWHEGVAVRSGEGLSRFKKLNSQSVRWIGRKPGTGARRCQDKVLPSDRAVESIAENHWEVAVAVRHGWVDAGVCHRLTAEQAGLEFLQVSLEAFDFCYPAYLENDPRIVALRKIVQSASYRKSLAGFRGIDTRTTGQEELV
ncbi:substrate-binding domain-containing protein [Desulfosoma caldarium]|uniref:XRE family transcriptional regulator of molybdate metabolism n=1 Tax=Desulfosoma caldarium TaxID=610254 RepID=A0A3N1UF00_9BACT|nr:substrate-binding domain-containing protein [Desulfosoma caldarium]ROQ89834.1 XRE family transcriptional regulator of molybdate metabolism [Desulfosoma caldarium]